MGMNPWMEGLHWLVTGLRCLRPNRTTGHLRVRSVFHPWLQNASGQGGARHSVNCSTDTDWNSPSLLHPEPAEDAPVLEPLPDLEWIDGR